MAHGRVGSEDDLSRVGARWEKDLDPAGMVEYVPAVAIFVLKELENVGLLGLERFLGRYDIGFSRKDVISMGVSDGLVALQLDTAVFPVEPVLCVKDELPRVGLGELAEVGK